MWLLAYLVVGVILSELGVLGAKTPGKHSFGRAAYIITTTIWPVVMTYVMLTLLTQRRRP